MARLFISYNHKEAPYAFAVRQWLMDEQEWASEDIFFDASHLHAGVEWEKKLLTQAEEAQVMLFLASENSLKIDSFCYRELKHATGQIIAVTIGGVAFNDERLDRALPDSAKTRQVTQLDKNPVEPFPFVSPVDGESGAMNLNAACVAGIGLSLREIGVAPNSYTWTPHDDGPFPGLRPLMEGDEAVFCGRDLEIRDGIKAIEDLRTTMTRRALIIQAPSGAGKSSFLRAGLWRRLRRNPGFTPLAIIRAQGGAIRHEEWGLAAGLFDTLKPDRSDFGGKLPLARDEIANRASTNLPGLLAEFADADRSEETGRRTLLLGIDQAEEMTALSPEDDGELDHLLQSLLHLPEDLDLRLVLTARDDSVDATLRRLDRAGLKQEQVKNWRLNRIPASRLDDIINGPAEAARKAGWPIEIDPALVDALVRAGGEGENSADALPILAITLQRMAAGRRAPTGRITLEPEEAEAFLKDVVSDAVGEALREAKADNEDLRKLVIPWLATWDTAAGSEGAAKRRVSGEATLFSGERSGLRNLAEELVDQRLLTRSQAENAAVYEVTHEALLRVPPLEEMIHDCREKFEQVRTLEVEAREWVGSGESTQKLVRAGERLEEAIALLEEPDFGGEMKEKESGGVSLTNYLVACRDHEVEEGRNLARSIMDQDSQASWSAAARIAVGPGRASENLVRGFFSELTEIKFFESERGVWARELLDHCAFPKVGRDVLVQALGGDELLPEDRLMGLLHSLRGDSDSGLITFVREVTVLGGPLGQKAREAELMAHPAPELPTNPQRGDLWVEPRTLMVFTYLPPGEFRQGEEDDVRIVALTQGFWIGLYPCIQREWEALLGENPSNFQDSVWLPVEKVSWNDVSEKFLPAINGEVPSGWRFSLPTEAQWEFACRGGTKTMYSFGDEEEKLGEFGWYGENSGRRTHPVGWKRPNPWGLFDMHGNVQEWCLDCYGDYEKGESGGVITDPSGPASGVCRVYRGGGWYDFARNCRSAGRDRYDPEYGFSYLGFRVALVPTPDGERTERTTGAAAAATEEPAAAEGVSGVSGF